MTRWARANSSNKKRPVNASSWEELKKTQVNNGKNTQTDKLSRKQIALKKREMMQLLNYHIARYEKQERRRLERKTAREKAAVCFSCRKSGHKLSECSDRKNNKNFITGICFKCGSTEHTSFHCKEKTEGYKFARCFICNNQGHIARECPDNPRGLYPNGGGCLICGSVQHLKSSCPRHLETSEKPQMLLKKIQDESADSEAIVMEHEVNTHKSKKGKTKVVTF